MNKTTPQAPRGVGVLDKAVAILAALADHPRSLRQLVEATGLSRPTAHRITLALERHGLVERASGGRFRPGHRLVHLAGIAEQDPLLEAAPGVLERLRDASGESAQLYRRSGSNRICIAAAERVAGLRDTVPVGALLPMTAGSAAQVLLAWEPAANAKDLLDGARFGQRTLDQVRRRGWAASVAEREPGVASVSAPVRDRNGNVIAAVSVSGPIDRLGRAPGTGHASAVMGAAEELSRRLATVTWHRQPTDVAG
ncbi:MAG: IclR family transcriptional regulator [Mycobacteriales bacterium]